MFETFYINDDIKIMLFYPRQVYKHFVEVSRAVLLQRIWKKFVRNNGACVRPLFLAPFTSKASLASYLQHNKESKRGQALLIRSSVSTVSVKSRGCFLKVTLFCYVDRVLIE